MPSKKLIITVVAAVVCICSVNTAAQEVSGVGPVYSITGEPKMPTITFTCQEGKGPVVDLNITAKGATWVMTEAICADSRNGAKAKAREFLDQYADSTGFLYNREVPLDNFKQTVPLVFGDSGLGGGSPPQGGVEEVMDGYFCYCLSDLLSLTRQRGSTR